MLLDNSHHILDIMYPNFIRPLRSQNTFKVSHIVDYWKGMENGPTPARSSTSNKTMIATIAKKGQIRLWLSTNATTPTEVISGNP